MWALVIFSFMTLQVTVSDVHFYETKAECEAAKPNYALAACIEVNKNS